MYDPPKNANGAIMEPVLTPVTNLNVGKPPASAQPQIIPAPKAPSPPPPDTDKKFAGGSGPSRGPAALSRSSDCSPSLASTGPWVSIQAQKRAFGRPRTVI